MGLYLLQRIRKIMKQKQSKLGTQTGSFINWMMSSNSSMPQIGMGATELHWSDRTPWEVIDIANDGKKVTIRSMSHDALQNASEIGMGHQAWDIQPNPNGEVRILEWKWNAWRYQTSHYHVSEQWDKANDSNRSYMSKDDYWEWRVYTSENKENFPELFKLKHQWNPMRILFGRAEYYYDWEF